MFIIKFILSLSVSRLLGLQDKFIDSDLIIDKFSLDEEFFEDKSLGKDWIICFEQCKAKFSFFSKAFVKCMIVCKLSTFENFDNQSSVGNIDNLFFGEEFLVTIDNYTFDDESFGKDWIICFEQCLLRFPSFSKGFVKCMIVCKLSSGNFDNSSSFGNIDTFDEEILADSIDSDLIIDKLSFDEEFFDDKSLGKDWIICFEQCKAKFPIFSIGFVKCMIVCKLSTSENFDNQSSVGNIDNLLFGEEFVGTIDNYTIDDESFGKDCIICFEQCLLKFHSFSKGFVKCMIVCKLSSSGNFDNPSSFGNIDIFDEGILS